MIYSDFRPMLNRIKFVQTADNIGDKEQKIIQFYDCQFTVDNLPAD